MKQVKTRFAGKELMTFSTDDEITLLTGGEERLKICPNGDFIVNSKKVENDKEVFWAFWDWITENTGIQPNGIKRAIRRVK